MAIDSSDREERLDEVVTAYLRDAAAGRDPNRRELQSRHPDFAAELAEFFADQDRLQRLAAPLRRVAQAAALPTPSPGFDATGAREPGKTESASEPILGRVADYVLLAEIGRGGMGVVYRARQGGLNRLVALKMVFGRGILEESRRFRNEAEMVAGLDHLGIVPVYEVGEHHGQLYFSMKLIEGGTLADHLDRYRDNPKGAARLMAAVARAVHHAHQRGILHRDLKPSNILLGADDQPLVTDFGLAKRLEVDSSLTQSGAIVGTPSYMAPEQASGARGAITTATDVYGLGALLYTLLCGRPPFKGETVFDTLEQIRMREPDPPSGSNPRIGRNLETICLKCLEKERERRYLSAEAMAEDLERWLRGEPILACSVGRLDRLWRWCRRNPVVAALGGLTLALLVSIAAVTSAAYLQTRAALKQAEAKTRWARKAVNEMYTQVAEKWLADEPHMTEMQRHFLRQAMEFYKELTQEKSTDPEVRAETGVAYRRLSSIQRTLLEFENGLSSIRDSIAVLEELVGEVPGRESYRLELLRSYVDQGWFLKWRDQFPEAEELLKRAAGFAAKLVEDFPDEPSCQHEQAVTLTILGDLLRIRKQPHEAEAALRRSMAIHQRLVAQFPAETDYQKHLGRTYMAVAELLHEAGQAPAAERVCRDAVAIFEQLVRKSPRAADLRLTGLGGSNNLLAAILMDRGHLEEAEKALLRSIQTREEASRDYPRLASQRALYLSYANYGRLLSYAGRSKEAEQALRRALEFAKKARDAEPTHPSWAQGSAVIYCGLANLYVLDPARHPEARDALPLIQKGLALQPDDFACLVALGAAYYRLGQWDRAQATLNRVASPDGLTPPLRGWQDDSTSLRRAAELNRHKASVLCWFFLAMCHYQKGDASEAAACYRRAVQSWQAQGEKLALCARELEAIRTESAALLGIVGRTPAEKPHGGPSPPEGRIRITDRN